MLAQNSLKNVHIGAQIIKCLQTFNPILSYSIQPLNLIVLEKMSKYNDVNALKKRGR